MRYITKATEVEARQWLVPNEPEAILALIEFGGLEKRSERWTHIRYEDGSGGIYHPMQHGDWIVKWPSPAFVTVLPDEEFKKQFVELTDDRVDFALSRNEIFWLASAHMFAVMVLDGRPPSAVSEAYKILVQNAKDLTTEGVNELYTRLSMIVQAKWPDSTTFIFPDENDNQPVAQRNSQVPPHVS